MRTDMDVCPDCGTGLELSEAEHACISPEEMTEHILTTKSVNSTVYEEGSDTTFADVHEGREEPLGHVTLIDYDDTNRQQAIGRLENKAGITVILRSSEGSYHAWNLCVQSGPETSDSMILLRDDVSHVRSGIRRGYWRLRIGPKVRDGGDTYKERPELETILVNETDIPQSLAHWRLARSLWDIPQLPHLRGIRWRGEALDVDQYHSLTDKAKEAWPKDGE